MTLTLRGLTTELKHYFTRIAGLFENYLQVKFKDPNLEVVCLYCMQTLGFMQTCCVICLK